MRDHSNCEQPRSGRIITAAILGLFFSGALALPGFAAADSTATVAQGIDVVVVDALLQDSGTLFKAVKPGAQLFVYNSGLDSAHEVLARVTDWAHKTDSRVGSLSILSHGVDGSFGLGNQWISASTLHQTAADWLRLSSVMPVGANLGIFGCDVASPGGEGEQLVNRLAGLTGADVFASRNVTGQGGDWVLEVASSGAQRELSAGPVIPFDLATLQASGATLSWFNPSWGYRNPVTVDHTKVAASQTNFPVLISTTNPSWRSIANGGQVGQADGGDFVFTSTDGTTQLDHQIESYDPVTGTLVAWVRVPALSSATDSALYLYYGNAGVGDQWNPTGVWETNFIGVWHLDEDQSGTGTNLIYRDSTSPNYHGDDEVSATGQDGQIGAGQQLDGSDDYIDLWDSGITSEAYTAFTLSAWYKSDDGTIGGPTHGTDEECIFWANAEAGVGSNVWPVIHFGITDDSGNVGKVRLQVTHNWHESTWGEAYSTTSVLDQDWHHVVAVRTGGGSSELRIYVDGVEETNIADAGGGQLLDFQPGNYQEFYIGAYAWSDNHDFVDGALDEVRLSTTARPATWIATEYNNQSDPASFSTIGPQVAPGSLLVVTTTSDVVDGQTTSIAALVSENGADGFISLREAIIACNNTPNAAANEIQFNIPGVGPHTIQPLSALPGISNDVIINGATEPDYTTTPVIQIDGSLTTGANGLALGTGSDGSEIRGLVINRFDGHGIYILSSGAHTIASNYLGTDVAGLTDLGNGGSGIYAISSNMTIGGLTAEDRNVIGGNEGYGIGIIGSGSSENTIVGNYIGLNASGTGQLFNDDDAISFSDAKNNTVGGLTAGHRNVICAGVGESCIFASASAAGDNIIQGNYIGTNAAGTAIVGGGTTCVRVSGAPRTIIGGDVPGAGNLMAGYLQSGVAGSIGAAGTIVQGNFIGTDPTGTLDLTNGMWGIILNNSVTDWTIGGTNDGAGNLIANHSQQGIRLASNVSTGIRINRNEIWNNTILGIDLDGDGVTPNDAGDGDTGPNNYQNFPFLAAAQTDAGTNMAVSGHLDSAANTTFRLEFFANPAMDPTLHGEGQRYLTYLDVTTDGAGFAVFGQVLTSVNVAVGEYISATATDPGGNTSEFSRHAVATWYDEIYVNTTSDISDGITNSITELKLAPGADGFISLREAITATNGQANGGVPDDILFDIPATDPGHFYYADDGISGQVLAANITVTTEADDAAIVGIDPDFARSWYTIGVTGLELPTLTEAVVINGATQLGFVDSPIIEIDGSALGSSPDGFDLDGGGSTIRGLVVNGFGWNGIDIQGADGNTIVGNYIGCDPSGTIAKPNMVAGIGVSASTGHVIGGTAAGDGNLISGNTGSGIQFDSAGNTAIGNLIGTTADGTAALGNGNGIYLNNVGSTTIGGAAAEQRNVISGNGTYGVIVSGAGAVTNVIAGNYIGTIADGTAALANTYGLAFAAGASNNTVGGTTAGTGNVISGNSDVGISFAGSTVSGNVVQGNYVGTNASGSAAVPNAWGIRATTGASSSTIGGSSPAARNVLSGNTNGGILLNGPDVSNHTIIGNYIGTNGAGTSGLPNNNGVYIMGGAHDNSVGGPLASDANLIAFNNYSGVIIQGASLDNGILGNMLHSNTSSGQVGIDLGGDGVTVNNGTKSASLPNFGMDYPVLTSSSLVSTTLTVTGYVGSAPGQALFANARVEFFESDLNASGHGEGQTYLGFLTADGTGNFSGDIDVSGSGVVIGSQITATATDTNSNTSEYSADATVTDQLNGLPTAVAGGPYTVAEGGNLQLDGSGSSDPDLDPLNYSWDLDNDLVYGDQTGANPTISWITLQGYGYTDDGGPHTIGLQVDDGVNPPVPDTAELTITNTPPTLTTTGDATILDGSLYTLDLSSSDPGEDTITGWTIYWGDGDITNAGAVASVSHSYSGAGSTYQILAAAIDEDGTHLQNQLLVAGYQTGASVYRIEPNTGNVLQLFGSAGDGLSEPYQAITGPDGEIYVSGQDSDNVLRYKADGTFDKVFVSAGSGGLDLPLGLTFGPDGNLYVTSTGTHQVLRYNGTTGAFIDVFVTAGSGGLAGPADLLFGPDSQLYVSSNGSDQVLRYNGTSGAYVDIFAAGNGLVTPEAVAFGPDGHLYVADFTNNNIKKFNGSNGAFIEVFASGGGLSGTTGMAFAPDGHLYVGSFNTHNVLRYNATTGAFVDEFVTAGASGLTGPTFLNFIPQQQVLVLPLPTYEISGTVFEDADFAGTALNWDGGTGDLALANVDVELYDVSDVYQTSTTTDGSGNFSFADLIDASYKVRVRSATIGDTDTPPTGGLHPTVPGTWPYPLAEMTWAYSAAMIGGQDTVIDDTATADNAGPGDTWVAVTVSGGDVAGVNLGFSYDVITNEDDDGGADNVRSKQGCFRQFIKNSNAIVGVNKSWFQIAIP